MARSLADHAEELEADLVVMFVHGRENIRHRLFGTMAQHVVRAAPAPILLLQPNAQGIIPVPFTQLLVPWDGRPEHQGSLAAALDFARSGGETHLLTVVPTYATLPAARAATGQLLPAATHEVLELAQDQAVQDIQQHLQPFLQAGLQASATVAHGDSVAVIREFAARLHADLLVIGTHGLSGLEAFWSGSVGPKLLSSIPASFLLAPAKTS